MRRDLPSQYRGGRAGHGWQPLACTLQPAPLCGRYAASGYARGRCFCPQAPPLRALPLQVAVAPCGLASVIVGLPLIGGLGRGWPALHGGLPPLLLAAFTWKTQQECVERFSSHAV
ncbi:hypothetical protein B296_00024624 [Ensete ventricosum]|uniref:Uncharacterized protein n=1 Tax=Ensete ventricosum TaxID=4639 RepID=A0A426Z9T4_ENSVE|nr:hypothetical protein B296_00024624 [Ensete ventricosum]